MDLSDNEYYQNIVSLSADLPWALRQSARLAAKISCTVLAWVEDRLIDRAIATHRRAGCVKRFEYRGDQVAFYLPKVAHTTYFGDVIQGMIFCSETFYDEKNLREIDEIFHGKIGTMLDIGANIGNHGVYFAKAVGAKRVYAFEPVAETFKILKRNIKLNKLDRVVTPMNVAVGSSDGKATIADTDPYNLGATQLKSDSSGDIKVISVDSMIDSIGHVDFIKIDTEGFELDVLRGCAALIKRDHPAIWVEVFPQRYEAAACMLGDWGYTLTQMDEEDNYLGVYDY